MFLLHEALGASETSTAFEVGEVCEFVVSMRDGGGSGWNAGTITMQVSTDRGTTYEDFTSDGADVTFTAADSHKTIEFGGSFFQFVADSSIANVDVYVGGAYVVDPNL